MPVDEDSSPFAAPTAEWHGGATGPHTMTWPWVAYGGGFDQMAQFAERFAYAWVKDPALGDYEALLESLANGEAEDPVAGESRALGRCLYAVFRIERTVEGTVAAHAVALTRVANELRRRGVTGSEDSQKMLDPDAEVTTLVAAMRRLPGLGEAATKDQEHLSNLPYCILGAIFSVGATYQVWLNVVKRYQEHYELAHPVAGKVPPGTPETTVSEFIAHVESVGATAFASKVLRNNRPTSSRGGILRAQAALEYAKVLQAHGVETIADVLALSEPGTLATALSTVPGQRSGISTQWFFMKAGVTSLSKPDRWILRFLTRVLGRKVAGPEAQSLLRRVCECLVEDDPALTVRALDLLIWSTERARV